MKGDLSRFLSGMQGLVRHPKADRATIEAYRDARLRRLVRHAYENVAYYRRLFDQHGIRPEQIRGVADLPRIPATSRTTFQDVPPADRVARGVDPERLVRHRTGGSSGQPLIVYRTWLEERLLGFFRLRALHAVGVRVTDRRAQVHRCGGFVMGERLGLWHVMQRFGAYRQTSVDCVLTADEGLAGLRKIRPDVISGYASAVARLARAATEEDRSIIRPRVITTGAEVLTQPMRDSIQQAFGAPVFDFYGAHEFNLVAWQCPSTGNLHVCDDGMVLEVLADERPATVGEEGQAIGTNLHCFASPIIRYRLGDIVERGPSPCPCGAPFGTVRAVQGRTIDFFHLAGGRVVHPYALGRRLNRETPWIRARQGIQDRVDHVLLRVVPDHPPTDEELDAARSILADVLGPDVQTTIEFVAELRPEPNGKVRSWASRVRSEYDGVDRRP